MDRRGRSPGANILHEPTPCDSCVYRPRCAQERLACEEYQLYIGTTGSSSWTGPQLPIGQRVPTRALYDKVHAHHPTKAETAWRQAGKARTIKRAVR